MKRHLPKGVVQRDVELLIIDEDGKQSIERVMGWVYKGLAVTRQYSQDHRKKSWVITHLATGHSFERWGATFLTKELAIAAMIEVDRLRADWRSTKRDDYTPLKKRITDICMKHSGVSTRDNWYSSEVKAPLNVLH